MNKQIYLDNGATTQVANEVVDEMLPVFKDNFGNPSSLHNYGSRAANTLKLARQVIADKLNADTTEIIFCSGGTESDNMAIFGVVEAIGENKGKIITTKVEHPAVLRSCEKLSSLGYEIIYLNVDREGFADLEQLKKEIDENTLLVSIMHVNNEIGTINPLFEIGEICREKKVLFHSDCVQSFTKVPIDVKKINIDLISMSSHKIHGPKGVGALYIRKGTKFKPQIIGGHQEHKKRGGTENIPGIVGFAKAVTIINKEDLNRITELRDMMIEKLLEIPDTQLNGPKKRGRCCNNVNICFNFIEGESLVLHLDMAGIAVSTASACSNLELKASHVLLSIGLRADVAHGAIRFVLSKYTTKEDVLFVIEKTKEIVENLRKISPIKKGVNINEYIHCEDDDCHDACEYGKK